jgi:DNA-binding MarR family transcriptional regulator
MEPSLPPDRSLGFQVRRCHRAFDRVLNARLAGEGFSSGFWYFLRALWTEDGVTQKRLAQLTNVTEPTAVTVLSAMDKRGLVKRVRNAEDRRKINVFLTPRAQKLERDLIPIAMGINETACAGVSDADFEICLSVLKKVSENLATEALRLSAEPTGVKEAPQRIA